MTNAIIRPFIRKPGSVGLVTATGAPTLDAMHVLGANRSGVRRTAIIRKIMCYNNTGANVTLQFGTRDFTAPVPLFVQMLPDLVALNGLDSQWNEDVIAPVEFSLVLLPTVTGREGNIYLQASAANVIVAIEVDEFGS